MARRKSHHSEAATQGTEETHRAVDEVTPEIHMPKAGETYHCERCGMEIEVTADCNCMDADMVHLECCGQDLVRV